MRDLRQLMDHTLTVNIHSDRDRKPLGGLEFSAGEKITEPDRVALPGNIDVDAPFAAINLYILAQEDVPVKGLQFHDLAGALHIVGPDPEPGHHRPLHADVQDSVDIVLCPQIKQIVDVRSEGLIIPSCMIFKNIPCIGKDKYCHLFHSFLAEVKTPRPARSDIWIISCLDRAWYNNKY